MGKLAIKLLISLDLIIGIFTLANIIIWFLTLKEENFIVQNRKDNKEYSNYKWLFVPLFINLILLMLLMYQKKSSNYEHKSYYLLEKLLSVICSFISLGSMLKILILIDSVQKLYLFMVLIVLNFLLQITSMFCELFVRTKDYSFSFKDSMFDKKRHGSVTSSMLYRDSNANGDKPN